MTNDYLPMTAKITPFHVAVTVYNLPQAREFYREVLGCEEGRSTDHWVDFNFFGHQFVIHLQPRPNGDNGSSAVDGHNVPIPHYGVVLEWDAWHQFADRLREKGVKFELKPGIRFVGQPGEQATMFFLDPSGNALEFKAFKNMGQLFAK